ncbi:MAG: Fic family protein [Deltaproteobacteria bacterium]|nr:Fic family protein [Deltaproteobacteria bacterium]
MPEQKQLFFLNNQNLFSNNYLEHRLPAASLWKEQGEKAGGVFDNIKKLYEAIKPLKLGSGEEAGIEEKFIRPVLKTLGYEFDVQPRTQRGYKKKRPDYALFKDNVSYEEARKEKDNIPRFFTQALTILEAKSWGRRLNDTDPKDALDTRDPTAQTVKYLDDVYHASQGRIQWAILTNGKEWRLFYYRAASRSGNFFEVSLENIIRENDREKFLYFYLFFSRDAFIPDLATGKTWLDLHLDGSEAYAKAVSDRLKELIFDEAFEGLAEGFIHYRRTELSISEESDESKKEIFKGCLTLLYRLLFLLYAESRNLLPVEEEGYRRVSLKKLKEDIYRDLPLSPSRGGQGEAPDKTCPRTYLSGMSKRSYACYARLEGLFEIIAKGDPALNVPIYNGGLFENNPPIPPLAKGGKGGFLAAHKIPDPYLAKVVNLLTVDHEDTHMPRAIPFIDYSSLNVRHLGDIYEGLLEFHIQIADEDMVEVREGGRAIWKKLSPDRDVRGQAEVKTGAKTGRRKIKGEIYIENSKHERKATGSYYTPHYIVEYIVRNTVNPALEKGFETVVGLLAQLEQTVKASSKQNLSTDRIRSYRAKILEIEEAIFNVIFDIKVLDPAMGSGHFLVHTVDFISDKIISFLAGYPGNPVIKKIAGLKQEIIGEINRQGVRIDESKLTEVNLIKRMVMKRCIYGVDLNEMAVELAKLSLWLDSFTLGAPLSFLDHHLKCGNSLIGANLEALEKATEGQLFKINIEPLKRAIRDMLFISSLSDATYQQVKDSASKYREADTSVEGYRMLLDMLVSEHFGIKEAKSFLLDKGTKIDLNNLKKSIDSMSAKDKKVIEDIEKAAARKQFFHWEIEFPEVFYERVGEHEQKVEKKENAGFDCVIGNPPYDVLSELEQGKEVALEKEFFSQSETYKHAVGSKLNFYRLFSGLSLNLLQNKGVHGFIVPMALLADKQAKPLRENMLKKYSFQKIEAFPQKDDPTNRIFFEAKLSTCIYILKKDKPSLFSVRIHPGKDILETSNSLLITPHQIEEFDKENLSIPSYPDMTGEDFKLALQLNGTSNGITLGHFAPSQQGEVNLTGHCDFLTDEKKGQVVLRGGHINRYEFQEEPKQGEPMYLDVKRFLDAHGKNTKAYDYRHTRIGYQRGAAIDNWRRIIATIVEKDNFCSDTINYIITPKEYNLFAILALLNSSLWEWRFRLTSTNNHVNSYEIDSMPMPPISFTTPEKERKEKVFEAIGLYEKYMLELNKGTKYAETEAQKEHSRAVEDDPHNGRKTEKISGKHSGAGKRIYGIRGRVCKPEDVERVSEKPEEYRTTARHTRFIESSLGIKSYSELAPHLAKGVERVMTSLLEHPANELRIIPEFICKLHKNAFVEFFPSWAGCYRDRDVTVGTYNPPPYYEVPVLMRQYCDDVEFRLSSLGIKPQVNDILFEAFAFVEGRLLSIHPFVDFNGRIARMLLFGLLYRLDLPPVQLVPDEKDEKGKKEYFDALAKADTMDWQPLIEVWRKRFGSGKQI